MNASETDLLSSFLNDRDVACPGCGYNLRGLAAARCPECGGELTLQVGLAEPRQAAMIAGLIGLSAGAGFSTLPLVVWGILVGTFRGSDGLPRLLLFALIITAVEAIAIVCWLCNWRRIRRLRPFPRWSLVAGCWMLALLNLIVFTLAAAS